MKIQNEPECLEQMIREHMKQEHRTKARSFDILNKAAKKGQILFTGSSLMEQFPVVEMTMDMGLDYLVYNRGIGGTTTDDFLERINTVCLDLEPSRLFINIGTNDMHDRYPEGENFQSHILRNYGKIMYMIAEKLPEAEVYIMAFYPANLHMSNANPMTTAAYAARTRENLNMINKAIRELALSHGFHFINVNEGLTDEKGELREELTIEGVHMYANGYEIVLRNLEKYLK